MKLIIADRGGHDIGKSTAIKNVFNELRSSYPDTTTLIEPQDINELRYSWVDVKATIKIGNTLVGIESQGDPGTRMQKSVDDFINQGCEIILVACRNQGGTINKTTDLETNHGYTVLWLQNGKCTDNLCWKVLEDNYGYRVADIIEKCALSKVLSPIYL
ncbi:MAG: hypothetical protein IJT12_07235 [Paludibacteraceae bacterium]|nr:hypothetical protein [Paludibacteraceae bacterium]